MAKKKSTRAKKKAPSKSRSTKSAGKTAFVTGGSGFLGINLIRFLHKRGYKIINYDLLEFDYKDMMKKITSVQGDIRDLAALTKAMKGADVVVHTAAALPLYKPEEIYSTDIKGTENVMKAALNNKIKRVVHISSTAVYGIPDHHPLFEHDPKDGVGPYGEAKVAAEDVCVKYRKKGLVVPIVRPKSFIGPERLGVMAIYYEWIRRGKGIPVIGTGKNRYQLLDVEDLCTAIHLCMTKPAKVANDVYNIGAKEFTTMAEDFGELIKYTGSKKKVVPLPAWPAITALRALEAVGLSPLYKWVYETAPEDSFVSIDKAEKKLGFTPKYSNKQALIRNYNWYIDNYDSFKNQTGVTHRVPWKQGALEVVSWFF